MKSAGKLLIYALILVSIFGCAPAENGGSTQPDYESTKKMMVDMLKTDEAKEAIKEIMEDEEVKQHLVMEQGFVGQTIQQTLVSTEGKKFWVETMEDPEFAKAFAESMQQENEKLLKGLMKDPEYQQMMMDILKDPEMEQATLDLLKTKEYRQQIMNVMVEAFESPYFVAKVNDLLKTVTVKAIEQADIQKEEESEGGEEEGQDSGGNEGEEEST
ncbi:spore germination lipoprotein GerD [Bacillus sp. FJAT-45350]|uniref:spore germination lipoprotein GerD n=1 Tax=Bacillus sp. FJAT-45350 TaxID=2011014 RepID=UPI000BB7CD50|nr:spore germination lipoprotein GerD [Bacillus sp. FJAT-45350]